MNILILIFLVLNIILPLAAYLVVRTLSCKHDTNARWHRQVLLKDSRCLCIAPALIGAPSQVVRSFRRVFAPGVRRQQPGPTSGCLGCPSLFVQITGKVI